jgi:hypothetical protein
MASVLSFIAVVAVCAALWWFAYKLEPHWVSRDGQRVVCYGQALDKHGAAQGRWRELRVSKVKSNTVEVRVRRGSLVVDRYAKGSGISLAGDIVRRRGKRPSYWRVVGQTPDPPRKKVVYLLNSPNDQELPEMLAIRLPANSKSIPMLESVSVNRVADRVRPSQPSPGTLQSEDQPDRS